MFRLERLLTALALLVLTLGPGPVLGHSRPNAKEGSSAWSGVPLLQISEGKTKLGGPQPTGAIPALHHAAGIAAAFILVLCLGLLGQVFISAKLYLRFRRLQLEGG